MITKTKLKEIFNIKFNYEHTSFLIPNLKNYLEVEEILITIFSQESTRGRRLTENNFMCKQSLLKMTKINNSIHSSNFKHVIKTNN